MDTTQINPKEIKDWIELSKYYKGAWMRTTDRGDMPPTVFAERDGNVLCAAIAPQVDKMMGLDACAMLRKGLNADVITMIVDAHIYHGKPGQSEEEFFKNKPKDMQKACDEEGACETGLIADCLVCHRIDKQKHIQMASIPYYYHGKETTFKWLNDPDGFQETIMDEREPDVRIEGDIPHALRQIMNLPTFVDDPLIKMLAAKFELEEVERQAYHIARAVYAALAMKEFMIFDYFGYKDPWEIFQARQKAVLQQKI